MTTEPETQTLSEVLRGGRQCDEDGVEIIMSREACCVAADELDRLETENARLKELLERRQNEVGEMNDTHDAKCERPQFFNGTIYENSAMLSCRCRERRLEAENARLMLERDTAISERDACKADAERYRWLRKSLPEDVDAWTLTRLAAGLKAGDEEIDAAIAAQRKKFDA